MDLKIGKNIIPKPSTTRRICAGPAQKGLMEKFIETHAKHITDHNNNNDIKGSPIKPDVLLQKSGSPIVSRSDNKPKYRQSIYSVKPFTIPINNNTTTIERDENGAPIRRGYIPVEKKIQMEINDLRNRELELRQSRANTPLNSPERITSKKSDLSLLELYNEGFQDFMKAVTITSDFTDSLDTVFSDLSEIIEGGNSSFNYHELHHLPSRGKSPLNRSHLLNDFNSGCEEQLQLSSKKLIAKWEQIIKENARK